MDDRAKQFEQLSAYLDGELTAGESLELRQVLAEDEELAAELESLRATRELLRAMPAEAAPQDFAHRVMSHSHRHGAAREPRGGTLRASRWISLATAAVVLMAAGVGMYIVVSSPAPEDPQAGLPSPGPAEPIGTLIDTIAVAELPIELIFTADLQDAERDVAGVLARNGVELASYDRSVRTRSALRPPADGKFQMSQRVQVAADTVEIEVLVSPEVAQQILAELTGLQDRQLASATRRAPIGRAGILEAAGAAPAPAGRDMSDAPALAPVPESQPADGGVWGDEAGGVAVAREVFRQSSVSRTEPPADAAGARAYDKDESEDDVASANETRGDDEEAPESVQRDSSDDTGRRAGRPWFGQDEQAASDSEATEPTAAEDSDEDDNDHATLKLSLDETESAEDDTVSAAGRNKRETLAEQPAEQRAGDERAVDDPQADVATDVTPTAEGAPTARPSPLAALEATDIDTHYRVAKAPASSEESTEETPAGPGQPGRKARASSVQMQRLVIVLQWVPAEDVPSQAAPRMLRAAESAKPTQPTGDQ